MNNNIIGGSCVNNLSTRNSSKGSPLKTSRTYSNPLKSDPLKSNIPSKELDDVKVEVAKILGALNKRCDDISANVDKLSEKSPGKPENYVTYFQTLANLIKILQDKINDTTIDIKQLSTNYLTLEKKYKSGSCKLANNNSQCSCKVNDDSAHKTSQIFLSRMNLADSANAGVLKITNLKEGEFTIESDKANDLSTVAYLIAN